MKRFAHDGYFHDSADSFELPENLRRHIVTVMRYGDGDVVEICDKNGAVLTGVLQKSGEDYRIEIRERRDAGTARETEIIAAIALFKMTRFEWAVEKLTEIGVDRIVPVECERSVVRLNDSWSKKNDRLGKIAVESSRQSLSKCPVIDEACTLKTFLRSLSAKDALVMAQPHAEKHILDFDFSEKQRIFVFTGPEGGFSPEEIRLCQQHGAQSLRLGQSILRAETAPIVACAILIQKAEQCGIITH